MDLAYILSKFISNYVKNKEEKINIRFKKAPDNVNIVEIIYVIRCIELRYYFYIYKYGKRIWMEYKLYSADNPVYGIDIENPEELLNYSKKYVLLKPIDIYKDNKKKINWNVRTIFNKLRSYDKKRKIERCRFWEPQEKSINPEDFIIEYNYFDEGLNRKRDIIRKSLDIETLSANYNIEEIQEEEEIIEKEEERKDKYNSFLYYYSRFIKSLFSYLEDTGYLEKFGYKFEDSSGIYFKRYGLIRSKSKEARQILIDNIIDGSFIDILRRF